jgi:two-component system, cell cycle sensor histidine kinase and response regulator CckA
MSSNSNKGIIYSDKRNSLDNAAISKRQTEEFCLELVESTSDSMYLVDEDYRYLFINSQHLSRMGMPSADIIGRSYEEFHSPEQTEIFVEKVNQVFKMGKSVQQEHYSRRDGRYFLRTFSPIKEIGLNGQIIRVAVVSKDITERKSADNELREAYEQLRATDEQMRVQYNNLVKSERSLRESEEKYRNILENIDESYFELDLKGNIIFFSDPALRISGYSRNELMGMNYRQYASPETAEKLRASFSNIYRKEEKWTLSDFEFIRKDKSTCSMELSVNLLRNSAGEAVGFRCIARDITERKRAEEELRKSEAQYRFITERMSDVIWTLDSNFGVRYVSPSVSKALGFTPEERMKQTLLERITPESFKKVQEVLKSEMQRDRESDVDQGRLIKLELEYYHKNGSTVWYETLISAIRDVEGNIIGFHGASRDITERRNVEKQRKELEERLRRAEKMEAIGTLAGGIAHDLNNVLGVLVGYSELLLLNVPQDSPFQRHAMQIFKGSQRAAAIIQDLLTLTRRGVVVSEVVNLNKIISDFLQMPEFEAIKFHHLGVQFKTSLDAELLNIKGSSTHLSKTVMNLLSNAAEAISGSGEVLIRTENLYVDRPIQGYDNTQEGEYAVLTVSDTGSGISPADLERIFEPFYTKKVMGRSGTGLGLAVVWGTVKDHDGYIDVQSTEVEGTTFTLYFPVTREDLTKTELVVPQSTYIGRGEHILVVDDVEGQRLLASAMLAGLGYKVSSVASGEEAIEFVRNKPVDLLILDMIMDPGIDGLDTYQQVLTIRPEQKAIIVSGFSETDRVHAAQSLGAGAYVRKPYVIEKLGLAVKKELDRK